MSMVIGFWQGRDRKRIIRIVCIACILFCCDCPAFGQPDDPGGTPPQPVPISGLEWLLVGGGALGASRLYKTFKGRQREP